MTNTYESQALVAQYLLFHYGSAEQQLPYERGPRDALDYPLRCVEQGIDLARLIDRQRALDLGCSVGRSTFELATLFDEVIGIDLSQAFIQAASELQRQGQIDCTIPVEGGLHQKLTLSLPPHLGNGSVKFLVGDALNLPTDLGLFDAVLAANLIDRVPDPARFLSLLPGLLRSGGHLVLTSPYTWLEAYTPREHWPEGTTFDFILEHLSPSFTLLRRSELPFLIREHARKYQWSMAEMTVWKRN